MTNLFTLLTENINGLTFIGIDTSTEPRMLGGKKNPFIGRVRKVVENNNVMVFQNKTTNTYNNMVMRRLEKEGKNPESFKLSPRKWGTRIPNTPFIEHKGQYYVEVIFLKKGKTHYELDGIKTSPQSNWNVVTNSENGAQGGLDDKVIIRTFKISSITQITINHNTYNDLCFDVK